MSKHVKHCAFANSRKTKNCKSYKPKVIYYFVHKKRVVAQWRPLAAAGLLWSRPFRRTYCAAVSSQNVNKGRCYHTPKYKIMSNTATYEKLAKVK